MLLPQHVDADAQLVSNTALELVAPLTDNRPAVLVFFVRRDRADQPAGITVRFTTFENQLHQRKRGLLQLFDPLSKNLNSWPSPTLSPIFRNLPRLCSRGKSSPCASWDWT